MDDLNTPNDAPGKQSGMRKKIVIGLAAISLIILVSLTSAVYLTFTYITNNIEATSLTIPLFADKPAQNQIAFVGNDDNLWLVSPDGQDLRHVTNDGKRYGFPTWSPDSRRLAFIGLDDTNETVLYISPASRSKPVVVFDEAEASPFYLYWAPDSTSITFLTQELSGLAMRLVNTRDPDMHRLLAEGAPFYWVWSPQSDKMLMHVGGSRAASEEAHISILENHQEAERVQLDLAPGRFQAPVWSSDGNHIYYIAANDQSRESIYKMNAQDLEQTVVTNLSGFAYMVLAPDDRRIAFLQIEKGFRPPFGRAYLVDTDGQNRQSLMDSPVASMYWSPDGKKLALLSVTRANDGPTAKIDGLASPLSQQVQLRWWIYNIETETLEPLFSFGPTTDFLQLVPYFDQYHLSLTFWSPDSRYIVVTKAKSDSHEGTVWVVDTTGQEDPRRVGEGTLAVWSWQ